MAALLVIVVLVGVGASFTIGAWHTRSVERPPAGWIITTGDVVAIHTSPNINGDYYYSPVISYQPLKGPQLRMTGPSTLNRPRLYKTVKVAFNPRSPSDAHDLSADQADWIVSLAVGMFLILLGAVVLPAGIWTLMRRFHR